MHTEIKRLRSITTALAATFLLIGAPLPHVPAQQSEKTLIFRNVDVFVGTRMTRRTTLLVRDGLIRGVGGDIAVPSSAQVIDGTGKTLLPGLFDAHTHLGATQCELFLRITIDDSLPVPFVAPIQKLHEIALLPREDWRSSWRLLIDGIQPGKPVVTTYLFVFTTVDGRTQYEECLAIRLGREIPNLTAKPESPISQETIDRAIEEGEKVSLVLYVREDEFQCADRLRQWGRKNDVAFREFIHLEPGETPCLRTYVNIEWLPVIDRTWHEEWPVRIELRPTTPREQLEQELQYWRHINDSRRAELVAERLSELDSAPRTEFD
jgi:hypothetical protein